MSKFTYLDSKQIEHTIDIEDGDFEFTQRDKKLFDQKFQTKPTTFFKDAMRRFRKNKSSVVGAWILGIIIGCAIVLPMVLPADVSTSHAAEAKLEPKLFDSGTGWWDGCHDYKRVAADIDWDLYDQTNGEKVEGLPADFEERAIVGGREGVSINELAYINAVNPYAHGGYVRLNLLPDSTGKSAQLCSWTGYTFDLTSVNTEYSVEIKTIDPTEFDDWTFGKVADSYSVYFNWTDETDPEVTYSYPLGENVPAKTTQKFSFKRENLETLDPDVKKIKGSTSTADNQKPFVSVVLNSDPEQTNNLLIEKLIISSSKESEKEKLDLLSILDANETLSIIPKNDDGTLNDYAWITYYGKQNIYRTKLFYCSFRYDTYEAVFGDRMMSTSVDSLKDWRDRGWLTAQFEIVDNLKSIPSSQRQAYADYFLGTIALTEEGKLHCPLHLDEDHPITGTVKSAGGVVALEIHGTITRWKVLYPEATSAPRYIFGTDAQGRDMFKLVFSGLRTSLLLGVITAVVTFAFGLVWGAIAGYFGGWTDILMERFTDLLHGIPWIVLMTLAIVRFGSSFGVFVMALCLTGWIGTASLTRTQFYRFKNREYILAARTLGASDFRLIFRHILPNAVGTIITSSVFMITSVIYSESTIAYLNLGLQGMDSFGVVLASNQQYITTYPHLILFPSIVMLLMMISFNLFGNGLRDAFNPSLKGEE